MDPLLAAPGWQRLNPGCTLNSRQWPYQHLRQRTCRFHCTDKVIDFVITIVGIHGKNTLHYSAGGMKPCPAMLPVPGIGALPGQACFDKFQALLQFGVADLTGQAIRLFGADIRSPAKESKQEVNERPG